MADEVQQPTLSDVEEWVNEYAIENYAKMHYSLPKTAFRVFLWPGNYLVKLVPGATARIVMGILPNHPQFNETMRAAIDRVATQHLYSTMAVEKVAHILERDKLFRRWFKEKYNFDPELIPMMLGDEELSIRRVERVEVVHKATGMREVIEVDQGKGRETFAAQDIAKMRLARRVREFQHAQAQPKDNEIPFPISA